MPLVTRRWFPAAVAATAAFGFYLAAMSYPWQLALLAATAIGALIYSAQVTFVRLRRLYAPPEEREIPAEKSGGRDRSGG